LNYSITNELSWQPIRVVEITACDCSWKDVMLKMKLECAWGEEETPVGDDNMSPTFIIKINYLIMQE